MAYATTGELTAYLGSTPPGAARLLDRASRAVDEALLTAVYDVDNTGVATDVTIATAIKNATLEQVAAGLDAGDTTGVGVTRGSFTLGRLSVQAPTAGTAGSARTVGSLWASAWQILHLEGLTNNQPGDL